MAERKELSKQIPVVNVIKNHKFACLIIFFMTWALSTTVMVCILMTPTVIIKARYHYDELHASIAGCVVALGLTVGCIFFGWLQDIISTRKTMLFGFCGLIVSSLGFYGMLNTGLSVANMMFLYGILGIFCGSIVTTPIIGTRIFPPFIRFSGLSFAYNVTYAIFSAITPQLTLYLLNPNKILGNLSYMGAGFYITAICIVALIIANIPLARFGWNNSK